MDNAIDAPLRTTAWILIFFALTALFQTILYCVFLMRTKKSTSLWKTLAIPVNTILLTMSVTLIAIYVCRSIVYWSSSLLSSSDWWESVMRSATYAGNLFYCLYRLSYCRFVVKRSGEIVTDVLYKFSTVVFLTVNIVVALNTFIMLSQLTTIIVSNTNYELYTSDEYYLFAGTCTIYSSLVEVVLSSILDITLVVIFVVFARKTTFSPDSTNKSMDPKFLLVSRFGVAAATLWILSTCCHLYYWLVEVPMNSGRFFLLEIALYEVIWILLFTMKVTLHRYESRLKAKPNTSETPNVASKKTLKSQKRNTMEVTIQ